MISEEAADWLQLIVDAGPDWLLAVTCLQSQVAKNGSVKRHRNGLLSILVRAFFKIQL